MIRKILGLSLITGFVVVAWGADIPGGMMRTAENLQVKSYELVISPSFLTANKGTYLTSELRYQPYDAMGVSASFGAGDLGLQLGVQGVWYLFAHANIEPEVSLLGAVHLNRVSDTNFFVFRLAPTVSQTFYLGWGELIPYSNVQMAPSFGLAQPTNQLSLKWGLGAQTSLHALDSLRIIGEMGVGLMNSTHQFSVAIAYPFST